MTATATTTSPTDHEYDGNYAVGREVDDGVTSVSAVQSESVTTE